MRQFYAHQKGAFRYAMRERHPALFLDMRLGKTLVVIRRCILYQPLSQSLGLRVLVVAPNSALGSWQNELDREGYKWTRLRGTPMQRKKALAEIYIISGDARPRWALINKEGYRPLPEIASAFWDAVIMDESTSIKNPKAQVTKFFTRNFRDVPHRWVLTGTPNPEGDHEFFCQLRFLRGGAFGCKTFWQFQQKHMKPSWDGYGWLMKPGSPSMIRREVARKCMVMRRRDVNMAETKVRERRTIEMPPPIREAYQKAEDSFVMEYADIQEDTKWEMTKYQWLRQMCGGFIGHEMKWDGKLKELLYLLQGELKNARVVVWFNYNQEIEAAYQMLTKAGMSVGFIHGGVKNREGGIKRFQAGRRRVLLIQQAVAQMGVDLSTADTAIYFSSPVGLMARQQTEDRIVSMKKAVRATPLLYIDLVVENSVDEDVLRALEGKAKDSTLTLSRALAIAIKERRKKWTKKD